MLRCKLLFAVVAACMTTYASSAQELFVYSEPASNMPADCMGVRLNNWAMGERGTNRINYHFIPEVMWGVNKNMMVHAEGYFSNRSDRLSAEGAGLYVKYRFYSHDKVYRHFRMAAFGRATTNNGDIHQEEIVTNGHNTGFQLGLIGTQLLHKTAISVTSYYEQATGNFRNNEFPATYSREAMNYSLSAGHLVLPKAYTSYKQTNLNLMVEVLGQTLLENGKQYLDIAPVVQLIFNSQTRLDIGYKFEMYSNMQRTAPNGLLIRMEHLFFNIL